jgi:tetratricopeptide (TPR) repeat protein
MKQAIVLVALLVGSFYGLNAQIKTPQPSPTAKISQEVGLGKIEVEYSRPSAKGRKIFGDLVPFGELWRTGANNSTKFTLSDDAKVAGTALTKGTYALYTVPAADKWTVVFYKNTSYWGTPEPENYKEEEVAAKVMVPVVAIRDAVETFTIGINNLKNSSADLELSWENTKVVVPIQFDVDNKVMADIKAQMDGPSSGTFYQSARYYYEEKKDMAQALTWVDKSLEKGGDKFWILRLKANILAELGRYKDAIVVAEKSTELAKKEGNADYPRMNDKSIVEWKKK